MGMGFAPTWLRQVSPPASQNHFNHWLWNTTALFGRPIWRKTSTSLKKCRGGSQNVYTDFSIPYLQRLAKLGRYTLNFSSSLYWFNIFYEIVLGSIYVDSSNFVSLVIAMNMRGQSSTSRNVHAAYEKNSNSTCGTHCDQLLISGR